MPTPPGVEDPMWLRYQQEFAEHYHRVFYRKRSIIRWVQESAHGLLEKPFGKDVFFSQVLEVGAGEGEHLPFVRHGFDRYVVSDRDERILAKARTTLSPRAGVEFSALDGCCLDCADHSFDRLISVFNLEHLSQPYLVLKEWARVVRPGGVISLAIPTEGGVAWELGRRLTTRRTFSKLGYDWDYIIARDHINSCRQLVSFIRHEFACPEEHWFPLRIPNHHINLVYVCNIRLG